MDLPSSWLPKKIIYTTMDEARSDVRPRDTYNEFVKHTREDAISTFFHGDVAAVAHAERTALTLIERWLAWLQTQSHELPTALRFDFLVKHVGPGRSTVTTG